MIRRTGILAMKKSGAFLLGLALLFAVAQVWAGGLVAAKAAKRAQWPTACGPKWRASNGAISRGIAWLSTAAEASCAKR